MTRRASLVMVFQVQVRAARPGLGLGSGISVRAENRLNSRGRRLAAFKFPGSNAKVERPPASDENALRSGETREARGRLGACLSDSACSWRTRRRLGPRVSEWESTVWELSTRRRRRKLGARVSDSATRSWSTQRNAAAAGDLLRPVRGHGRRL